MKIIRYLPFAGMALILLLVQLIAVALSEPFEANEIRAFSDPEDTSNVLYWVLILLIFTVFVLLVIKMNKRWIIQLVVLLTVASTLYYSLFALFSLFLSQSLILLAFLLSISLTLLLYKFPEWYIIDITGVLIGAGAASIFGISLAIIPAMILLILLAIYDYIAVYRTKHMIALAEGIIDLRLPILLVIPKRWNYSFLTERFDKEEREAFFMGLGDAVMPTILVVSANTFVDANSYILPLVGEINIPAIGAMIGSLVGFVVLMGFVMKGKPQAGLPFLNGGVILGYIIGSLLSIPHP